MRKLGGGEGKGETKKRRRNKRSLAKNAQGSMKMLMKNKKAQTNRLSHLQQQQQAV